MVQVNAPHLRFKTSAKRYLTETECDYEKIVRFLNA